MQTWMMQAACIERPDLDWFDLECELTETVPICDGCEVKTKCLDYAVRFHIVDGVWGGLWGQHLERAVRGHTNTVAARRRAEG